MSGSLSDLGTAEPDELSQLVVLALRGTTFELSRQQQWLAARPAVSPAGALQGWKLHVSAHPASAMDVLKAVLPVLARHGVAFKVAASRRTLMALNAGAGGPSQIGKFITVYPETDAIALAVAADLHHATQGLSGPRVPSDRPLKPGSLVHYRYGSFTGATLLQLPDGAVVSAMHSPSGEVVPDRREAVYAPPAWADCPFPPPDSSWTSRSGPNPLPDSTRYRVLGLLADTGRGSVLLGLDSHRQRRCVFKTVARDPEPVSASAESALRMEATLLQSLPPSDGWPEVYDLFETADQLVLVMQDIDGESLGEHVSHYATLGRPMEMDEVTALGQRVIEAVASLHRQGVVHRDLKSSNVLVRPDGGVSLVDFEHAARVGQPARAGGTRGYMSPQQKAGGPATVQDDIHAVGALLMLLTTGCEPSQAPDDDDLLSRPLELLRPGIPSALARVIADSVAPSAPFGPPDLIQLQRRLRSVRAPAPLRRRRDHGPGHRIPEQSAPGPGNQVLATTAHDLCDSLCVRAAPAANDTLTWASTTSGTLPVPYRQINNGVPGVLLALTAAWAAFGTERHRDVAVRGARWLAASKELPGARISGLFAGEAGVGAALLVGGLLTDDADMVAAAYECEQRLRSYPLEAVDLYHGTAGRLRFLVMLWLLHQDPGVLSHAERCAQHLHDTATTREDRNFWSSPDYSGGGSVASYAHGASGIADALLDLYEISGDAAHLELARGAARWVTDQAVPSLSGGTGADWGNGGAFSGLWCYGASGVGLLYLHLHQLGIDDDALDMANRAARTAAFAGRHAQPGLCHGLNGSIEFLLDVYRHTQEPRLLTQTWELQRLLHAYQHRTRFGLGYPPTTMSPSDNSYMLGDAGVVSTLIRQMSHGQMPRLLSTETVRVRQDPRNGLLTFE